MVFFKDPLKIFLNALCLWSTDISEHCEPVVPLHPDIFLVEPLAVLGLNVDAHQFAYFGTIVNAHGYIESLVFFHDPWHNLVEKKRSSGVSDDIDVFLEDFFNID